MVVDHEQATDLLLEYQRTGDRRLRNQVIEEHQDIARQVARRFTGRGVPEADLRQVALLAMVRAADRFDPRHGASFATFCRRTTEGELKRYLRDRSWSVRPPRSAQELHLHVRQAEEQLTHELGRSPSVREVAEHLEVDPEDVLEAMEVAGARTAASLDAPAPGVESSTMDRGSPELAINEAGFAHAELRLHLREVLDQLDERERLVVVRRFFEEREQKDIAEELGLSQSFVSRLLRRVLLDLRERLEASGVTPD